MKNMEISTEDLIKELSFYALDWNNPTRQKQLKEFIIRYKRIKTELENLKSRGVNN